MLYNKYLQQQVLRFGGAYHHAQRVDELEEGQRRPQVAPFPQQRLAAGLGQLLFFLGGGGDMGGRGLSYVYIYTRSQVCAVWWVIIKIYIYTRSQGCGLDGHHKNIHRNTHPHSRPSLPTHLHGAPDAAGGGGRDPAGMGVVGLDLRLPFQAGVRALLALLLELWVLGF